MISADGMLLRSARPGGQSTMESVAAAHPGQPENIQLLLWVNSRTFLEHSSDMS